MDSRWVSTAAVGAWLLLYSTSTADGWVDPVDGGGAPGLEPKIRALFTEEPLAVWLTALQDQDSSLTVDDFRFRSESKPDFLG
jgi:hypothetical protein